MIGWLSGEVLAIEPSGEVLVEVSGVGYRLSAGPTLLGQARVGQQLTAWVSQQVRDDAITLYGFATADERRTFEELLSAHKVGPSLAQAVLAHLRPDDLRRAVISGDVAALVAIPGVGKTTAQRMIIDLKSRLGHLVDMDLAAGTDGDSDLTSSEIDEVRSGLAAMGFSTEEINSALHQVVTEMGEQAQTDGDERDDAGADADEPAAPPDVASLLKTALAHLNKMARQ